MSLKRWVQHRRVESVEWLKAGAELARDDPIELLESRIIFFQNMMKSD